MKPVVVALLGAPFLATLALAQFQDPSGTWFSESGNTQVPISRCGEGYCGTIVAVTGETRDVNNPDPRLRSRSLISNHTIPRGPKYRRSISFSARPECATRLRFGICFIAFQELTANVFTIA